MSVPTADGARGLAILRTPCPRCEACGDTCHLRSGDRFGPFHAERVLLALGPEEGRYVLTLGMWERLGYLRAALGASAGRLFLGHAECSECGAALGKGCFAALDGRRQALLTLHEARWHAFLVHCLPPLRATETALAA